MKRIIALVLLFVLVSTLLCGCSLTCEHCGQSCIGTYNLVGDSQDGIQICNDCADKMRNNRLNFNFTCDECHEDKLGKKNEVTVDGEQKIVCNTCLEKMG